MNPDSENFEQLRRLLALKRHEQPPPGYFENFSGQVLARIRAGESVADRESTVGTLWQKLWSVFEAKTVFAGAFGAAVCAVLVSGVMTSPEVSGIAGTTPGVMPVSVQTDPLTGGGVPPIALNQDMDPSQLSDSNSIAALFGRLDQMPLNVRAVNFSQPVITGSANWITVP